MAAARQEFLQHGFSGATISEIAASARVAKGTLFLYARTKGDLLAQVFHDELAPVIGRSLERPFTGSLPTWLSLHFADIIDYNRQYPQLCRIFLKELAWLDDGQHDSTGAFVADWVGGLERTLRQAIASGEITAEADVATWSLLLIELLLSAMRRWLSGSSSYEEMHVFLASALGQLHRGLRYG